MLSMHADDDGSTENIHNLTEAELAIRKVDMIDIAFDDVSHLSYPMKPRLLGGVILMNPLWNSALKLVTTSQGLLKYDIDVSLYARYEQLDALSVLLVLGTN